MLGYSLTDLVVMSVGLKFLEVPGELASDDVDGQVWGLFLAFVPPSRTPSRSVFSV